MPIEKLSTAKLGSTKWWKNQSHNLTYNIFKLALGIFIFFLIWNIIAPIINNYNMIMWWREQKAGSVSLKAEKNSFSWINYSYMKSFKLYANIGSLLVPQINIFDNEAQLQAVDFLLKTFGDGIVSGGALTGKALCESIIPDWPPPAPLIARWLKCQKGTDGGTSWPKEGNLYVWPEPDSPLWMDIVYLWGGLGSCGGIGNACSKKIVTLKPSQIPQPCTGSPTVSCGSTEAWYVGGTKQKGDWLGNFLWSSYQIPFNSVVIANFLSGSQNVCDTAVLGSDQTLKILLGKQMDADASQGWWGAIKYISSKNKATTFSEIHATFWEGVEIVKAGGANTNQNDSKTCNGGVASGITKGVGAAAGVGMAVHGVCHSPVATAAGDVPVFGWTMKIGCGIGALVTAGVGAGAGMEAAGAAGCCSPIGAPPCCHTTPKSCPAPGPGTSACIIS